MRLLYGHSRDVIAFVNERLPQEENFAGCEAVGVINKDGLLVAGWVWHNHSPEAQVIEFSGAADTPRWMTRKILHEIFAHAFDRLGCQMIATRNSGNNTRLHRQLAAYGFDRHQIPRLFGRNEDGVVWTLTDDQWRLSRFEKRVARGQENTASCA